MRIKNFLENRQILNYHCSDYRSKVFVEQQLFSICFMHNWLGNTLCTQEQKSKNLLHSVVIIVIVAIVVVVIGIVVVVVVVVIIITY